MSRSHLARCADRRDVLSMFAALFAVLLIAALATSAGCAHFAPRERDQVVDVAVSLGQDCVAAPLVTCPWTEGPDAYVDCLWRQAAPCMGEHIAALAGVAFRWLYETRGVMLAAPASRDLRHIQTADRCVRMIDPEYVADHCPRVEPRMCVAAAVATCIDLALEGQAP